MKEEVFSALSLCDITGGGEHDKGRGEGRKWVTGNPVLVEKERKHSIRCWFSSVTSFL